MQSSHWSAEKTIFARRSRTRLSPGAAGVYQMSLKLMAQVWPIQMRQNDKFVLMALADNANDEGLCWPSISTLCTKTCLSRRGLQLSINRLIHASYLERVKRDGRSSHFYVSPLRTPCAPQDIRSAPRAHHLRTPCAPPAHPVRPEPSGNPQGTLLPQLFYDKMPASQPALSTDQQGREAGRPSQTKANGKHPPPLEPTEYQQLSEHCVKLGLHPASPALAPRLKQKLISSGVPPDDWIKKLGKFDKQTSAGLWDQKTAQELIAQSDPVLKRKAMSPVQAMIAAAEERLAAKAAKGGS